MNSAKPGQFAKGNALFLILTAVALFAALGFAVTKSRSSSGSIDREKMAMDASRLIQYASYVRAGAQRMSLTGTRPADILLADSSPSDDAPCTSGSSCLFAEAGGGLLAQPAPAGLGSTTAILYGEAGADLDFLGNGTTDGDLHIAVPVTEAACIEINKVLHLGTTPNTDSDNSDSVIDAYPGEPAACYYTGAADIYAFYMVIIPL